MKAILSILLFAEKKLSVCLLDGLRRMGWDGLDFTNEMVHFEHLFGYDEFKLAYNG